MELNWQFALEMLQDRRAQYSVLIGVAGVLFLRRLLKRNRYNLPPGPRGWPLLGNILSLTTTEKSNETFKKWKEEYGDVFTVYMGPSPWVILTTPELIREAFITKGQDFAGRIKMSSMDLLTEGGKDIALAQPGPIWKLQRRIAHSAIRKYASGLNLERNTENAMESFVTSVSRQADNIVDIPDEMLRMTYNFLASVCFGRQFEYDDPWLNNFQQIVKDASETIGSGLISDFIPGFSIFEKKKINAVRQFTNEFYSLLEKELSEHKESFDPEHPRDLTDEILLQIKKQKEDPGANPVLTQFEPAHLRQLLSDVFFGGTDTTRVTLAIVIGYMVKYPEIQAKLHQELDSVLGDTGKVTLKNKDELPYTNAVLHEAMRIDTVVPFGVPHATTKDTAIGKYAIPKGTTVVGHVHTVHRDPANYEHPDDFKPERWLDANGKFQYMPYKFVPFSMGPRVCLGESLARSDLQLFTAMMFHKYEFRSIDNEPFTVKLIDVAFGVETVPFKLKLIERN